MFDCVEVALHVGPEARAGKARAFGAWGPVSRGPRREQPAERSSGRTKEEALTFAIQCSRRVASPLVARACKGSGKSKSVNDGLKLLKTQETASGPLLQNVGMDLGSAPYRLGAGGVPGWGRGSPAAVLVFPRPIDCQRRLRAADEPPAGGAIARKIRCNRLKTFNSGAGLPRDPTPRAGVYGARACSRKPRSPGQDSNACGAPLTSRPENPLQGFERVESATGNFGSGSRPSRRALVSGELRAYGSTNSLKDASWSPW